MSELIGKRLGLYEIVAQLATGGMSDVYKAYQPSVDRYVAIKVLRRQPTKEYEIFVSRFLQEAQVVAKLEHPHILPMYDFGETEDYLYLVMRLVNAGTLWDRFHGQPFPLEQIRQIIIQVGDALDYAHSQGVIHRDIKPKNILMDERDNCLLTDFGIAKLMQTDLTLTQYGTTLGTPTYMSPEQIQGEPLDGRSDIYALGVILFQLATGHLPYEADTPHEISSKHLYANLPSARALNPALPKEFDAIIAKAMAKDRSERYATAGDLVHDIKMIKFEPPLSAAISRDGADDESTEILSALELDQATSASDEQASGSRPKSGRKLLRLDGSTTEVWTIDELADESVTVASKRAARGERQGSRTGSASASTAEKGWTSRTLQGKGLLVLAATLAAVVIVAGLALVARSFINVRSLLLEAEASTPTLALAVNNSNIFLSDNFDDSNDKRLAESTAAGEDGVLREYADGTYVIEIKPVIDREGEALQPLEPSITFIDDNIYEDFIVEVTITEEKGDTIAAPTDDANVNMFGLTFRNQGRSYYNFEINTNGSVRFSKYVGDEEAFVFNEQSEEVQKSSTIKLRISTVGSNFTIQINDKETHKFTDPAEEEYLKQGSIGFLVNSGGKYTARIAFDDLKVWVVEKREE